MQTTHYYELTHDDAIVAFAADWKPGDRVYVRRHSGSTVRCTIDEIDVEAGCAHATANEDTVNHDAGDRIALWPQTIDRIVVSI